jgi:hypothetical protein
MVVDFSRSEMVNDQLGKKDAKTTDKKERICPEDVGPLPFVRVSLEPDDDDEWEKIGGDEDEWEVI